MMNRFLTWMLAMVKREPVPQQRPAIELLTYLYLNTSQVTADESLALIEQDRKEKLTDVERVHFRRVLERQRQATLDHYWKLMARPDIHTMSAADVVKLTENFYEELV